MENRVSLTDQFRKENTSGRTVFRNGVPDLSKIPKAISDAGITVLELQIAQYYEQKRKSKKVAQKK